MSSDCVQHTYATSWQKRFATESGEANRGRYAVELDDLDKVADISAEYLKGEITEYGRNKRC